MLMFNWFAPKVFNQGYLPEEDGHQVFFMEAGSKDGKPVLVFHGGPGGASRLRHAEAFYRRKNANHLRSKDIHHYSHHSHHSLHLLLGGSLVVAYHLEELLHISLVCITNLLGLLVS